MSGLGKVDSDDETLVMLARKGDNNAMAALIAGIVPLVKTKAAAMAGKNLEADDLAQEGMLGFLSAVYTYRPGGEAAFRTYASACIKNRIISAVRTQLSRKNMPLNFSIPLDDEDTDYEAAGSDPQNILIAQEETSRILAILNSRLSKMEKKIMQQYLSGLSYEQIAKALGTSAKAVDNALQRAKKKLKSSESQALTSENS